MAAANFTVKDGNVVAGPAFIELQEREAEQAREQEEREKRWRDGTAGKVQRLDAGALVGGAEHIDLSDEAQLKALAKRRTDWHDFAWGYCDTIGPLKFANRFLSHSLHKVRMFGAIGDPNDVEAPVIPVQEAAVDVLGVNGAGGRSALLTAAQAEQVQQEIARLRDDDGGGQGALLANLGVKVFVAGDSYVVTEPETDGQPEMMRARSVDELFIKQGKVWVKDTPNDKGRELPADTDLCRVWRSHDRWRGLADSNLRGILDDCAEYTVLRRMFAAIHKSRLSGGVLLIPSEFDFVATVIDAETGQPKTVNEPTAFDRALMESMVTPVGDDTSPANVVPVVVKVKGEAIAKAQWLKSGREISSADLQRAKDLITAIAQGIDFPNEVLLGVADVNHWTAWQIDDATYRAHVEPNARFLADEIASGIVRPRLIAIHGWERDLANRIVIGLDPSDLVASPDRAQVAKEALTLDAISWEAYRRETGHSDDDAPTVDELVFKYQLKGIARKPDVKPGDDVPPDAPSDQGPPAEEEPDPAPPTAALLALGRRAGLRGGEPPVVAAARPSRRVRDVGDRLAAIDRTLLTRLTAAADAAMERTLERAGARLRSAAGRTASARQELAAIDNEHVAHHLGVQRANALVADADLLDGAFDGFGDRFDELVGRAQGQARRQVGVVAGDQWTDRDDEELTAQQDRDRSGAWLWLAGALVGLARSRLFDPSPTAPPQGEHDTTLRVQPGVLREALARAGGTTPVASPVGGLERPSGGPVGLVATGDLVRHAFAQAGFPWTGYRWDYGDAGSRSRPFEPHEELDGVEFVNWQDDQLLNAAGDWPGNDYWRPGDHLGCQCSFTPLTADSSDEEPADDEEAPAD